ncbi:TetR/AcrR family transcriptional regulator [Ciceribacter sp. L1K23]|uniref:TetR/AcrR family transcriptional regulator n=1 Tax=unclassified Ciceribacter TaxID=2628820 RepID=UPI001ABDCC13|nr:MULTISPECIES: TetR/AcrR family transcriptional regulator [unclassified Ciceribacter]MBO3760838.1 TetR/AcrR family transcriptional regulator [Ciceribacter sp. L1K22]MBR0555103.1 TetR/AcrR family transcriptional regulator [Ciceribacter sp. L1K23]
MIKARKLTRAEQKALRPIQILDAAFEEFVANGFSATRVEDIADRIGVTKGTIYVYFPTKEDLFSAMIRHVSVPIEDLLRETDGLSGSFADQLRSFFQIAYEKVTQDRRAKELLRFVVAEGTRFPEVIDAHHAELIEPLIGRTQQILDEGIAAGEFRSSPTVNADIIVAPILTLMIDLLIFDSRRTVDLPAYMEAHLDLVLKGISAARD